jgi:phage-related protein
MPVILNSEVIREKNALHSANPFLLLLEIVVPGLDSPLRVVLNTENIRWRGVSWQAITFELDEISQGGTGEVPQVELRVANPGRVFEPYIDMYDEYVKHNGFTPITVHILVINTADMDSGKPVVDHEYELKNPQSNGQWIVFTLGASNPFDLRFPVDRILKGHCRFRFRDRRCNYKGAIPTCNHTLTDCRKKGNSARFGGFPGIGKTGIYLSEM